MIVKDTWKELEIKCPICGSELNGTQYSDEIWGAMHTVEIHSHCPKCTFREEMCYSEPFAFICETDSIQNRHKAEQLGIKIIPEEGYYLI